MIKNDAVNPAPDIAAGACYFRRDGERFVPTPLACSPWDARNIAGGPISALLASGAEDAELDKTFEVARFQVDIFGKVPHQPLTLTSDVLRDGLQTKLHRITMLADGKPVAQAHILRVRRLETPVVEVDSTYPPAETVAEVYAPPEHRLGGTLALRLVSGDPGLPGRTVAWLGLNGTVIEGRPPSRFVKACYFGDFGSGFGNATDAGEWSYANIDITIQFLRMPVSDWLLIDAQTQMAGNGHGTARSVFADANGIYARGFQTVFVAPGHLSVRKPDKGTPKAR